MKQRVIQKRQYPRVPTLLFLVGMILFPAELFSAPMSKTSTTSNPGYRRTGRGVQPKVQGTHAPKTGGTTNPAYLSSIPGSSDKIRGSRPRTYLKPSKMSYQQHMASMSVHPFKNEKFKNKSDSFGYRAGDKNSPMPRVLSSSPPSSRINVQQHRGRPAAGVARKLPLSESDYTFMGKLTEDLKATDPGLSSRLGEITAGQKQNRPLSKGEYDLLISMAQNINEGDTSYRLHSIAEKRRQDMY